LKSLYTNEEFPRYAEQLAFDEKLANVKFLDFSDYGPTPQRFQELLQQHRWTVEGFDLVRSKTVPSLDAPCGRYLSYRQLIECGETQQRTRLANLPKDPDTFTALYELAINVLDPIIEYFGSIKLTYGFCSPELSRAISGGIAPSLDQHAAHEKNRKGSYVCPRLGAKNKRNAPEGSNKRGGECLLSQCEEITGSTTGTCASGRRVTRQVNWYTASVPGCPHSVLSTGQAGLSHMLSSSS
jgi:hypothetical protein